jgi:Holliday junction DNA helicase RuvA
MIAKLTGLIDSINETSLILDVGGVGYHVSCSSRTLGTLGHKGEHISLCIETIMRAESLHLYGFKDQAEQDCFRLLTTVQGVGTRMGLALLSALSPTDIYQAIGAQDKASLIVNLGYRRLESMAAAHKAQQELGEGASLNDLIRQSLSLVARSAA